MILNKQGVNLNMENPNLNEKNQNPNLSPMCGQKQPQPNENWSDPSQKRAFAIDLWRSLSNVNENLPEDLQTKSFGECWLRSRCPMPRLRISDGVNERMIPWYSVLEIHADSTFRIFEIYLAGDVVCRIISRRPQEELYANFQLERVKVIYPTANVSVRFEDLKAKKPGPV